MQLWWFLPSVLTPEKLRPTFGVDYCNVDDRVWQGLWMILWALSTAFPEGFMPILGVVSSNLKPLFWQNVTSPGYQESDCHLDCPQVPAGFLPDSATADDSRTIKRWKEITAWLFLVFRCFLLFFFWEHPLTVCVVRSHQQMRQFVMHKKPHSGSHLSTCVCYHALVVCFRTNYPYTT